MMRGQQNVNLDGNEIGVGVKADKTIHTSVFRFHYQAVCIIQIMNDLKIVRSLSV
jgi:hypothetical protein